MSKRLRLLIILALIGVSVAFIAPTVRWYFFVSEEEEQLAAGSREQVRDYAQSRAEEDLEELRGLAAGDQSTPVPEEYRYLIPEARANFELVDREIPDAWTVATLLSSFRSENEAFDVIEAHYRAEVDALKNLRSRIIELGLDLSGGMSVTLEADEESLAERLGRQPTQEDLDQALDIAVEILTSRIDQFGVTEPEIRRQEPNQIAIEIPGAEDRERVNSFLMGRGSLSFRIVDDEATSELIRYQSENPGWDPEEDGVPEFVPAGTEVTRYVTRDEYGIDRLVRYIVVYESVEERGLDGSRVEEAQVTSDPITGRPEVNFVLDREGANEFARLTRDNVGSSMAVVMNDQVRAYATIQEEIAGGQARISGFDQDEAQDIATVLRTAALPVDLEIVNQQAVGASLGADTIQAGLQAIALGFALVIVFMIVYYQGAGLIADLALILNLFFILATLSVFNLTLTLTSIAGIILTVGMAVDANVIIFERIREEYRLGKSAAAAVRSGFGKALWTILDANITTFIAAIFLSQLGTGPIQGFAVTLAVGIVWSMITALVVSRLVFDFGVDTLKVKKLSIGWGVS